MTHKKPRFGAPQDEHFYGKKNIFDDFKGFSAAKWALFFIIVVFLCFFQEPKSAKKQLKSVFFCDKMAPDFIGKNKLFVFGNIFLSTKNFVPAPQLFPRFVSSISLWNFHFFRHFPFFFCCSFGLWKKHKMYFVFLENAHLAVENPWQFLKKVVFMHLKSIWVPEKNTKFRVLFLEVLI